MNPIGRPIGMGMADPFVTHAHAQRRDRGNERDNGNEPLTPPATASGLRRVGDVANELVSEWGAARIDTLSARIAANQVERLRELSLLGYAPRWSVVETSLRLEVRRILEEVMDA